MIALGGSFLWVWLEGEAAVCFQRSVKGEARARPPSRNRPTVTHKVQLLAPESFTTLRNPTLSDTSTVGYNQCSIWIRRCIQGRQAQPDSRASVEGI